METRINIGDLDTLVALLSPAPGKGAEGEKYATFSLFRNVFARVDRTVSDDLAFDNYDGRDSVGLAIYKVPQLTTRWRVSIQGRIYQILSIDEVSRVSPVCLLNLQSID